MAQTQDLYFIDYFAPDDELTIFDNFGAKNHFRLGPHSFKKIEEIKGRKKLIHADESNCTNTTIKM
uniref:Uncharacterized protein n=1 Tax=Strongyloides papillosus TaxID=174720 RepID=A0A0N5CGC6_STREA